MWAQVPNLLLGIWLMIAPAVFGLDASLADSDRIVGLVTLAVALISSWEVTRPLRWINLASAAWLALAPLALGFVSAYPMAAINDLGVAVLLLIFAFKKGKIIKRYGGGWAALLK